MICVCGTKLCELKMVLKSDILDHPVCLVHLHVQADAPYAAILPY